MKNILIIDDETDILSLCEHIFHDKDYNIQTARNRLDADLKLSQEEYNLVIIDCTLGMYVESNWLDDITAEYPNTGVIVMSGYFHNEEIAECRKKGAFCCLDKPFKQSELLDAVNGYFNNATSLL